LNIFPKLEKKIGKLDPGQRAWKLKLSDLSCKLIRGRKNQKMGYCP
jgi:hypothetical protein